MTIVVKDGNGDLQTIDTLADLAAVVATAALQGTGNTTLASILAKLSADPSTQTTSAAILAKLSADPATQTTLAAILAKLITTPATEAKQDSTITVLNAIGSLLSTQAGYLDGLEALLGPVATQATLAAVLAKLSADPSTQTTSAAILAKLSADPATQTTLAAVLAKLTADPATQTTLAAVLAGVIAATPAGEAHIGAVGGHTSIIPVTLSLDTSAYAAADLLADTQIVSNAMRVNDGTGVLNSVMLIDQDDQGVALDLYILNANVTMGTENAAPSISDANALNILGRIQIASTDWYDLGGCRIANLRNLAIPVKGAPGTRNVYIAAVNGAGTPTFTASGVVVNLGFFLD